MRLRSAHTPEGAKPKTSENKDVKTMDVDAGMWLDVWMWMSRMSADAAGCFNHRGMSVVLCGCGRTGVDGAGWGQAGVVVRGDATAATAASTCVHRGCRGPGWMWVDGVDVDVTTLFSENRVDVGMCPPSAHTHTHTHTTHA